MIFVRLVQASLCIARQHHMTVHFFFLSVGSASNIFCRRSAMTGKLGRLLGCGSQHSSTRAFTGSGTTFPNLQRSFLPHQRSQTGQAMPDHPPQHSPTSCLSSPGTPCHACEGADQIQVKMVDRQTPFSLHSRRRHAPHAFPRSVLQQRTCCRSCPRPAEHGSWPPAWQPPQDAGARRGWRPQTARRQSWRTQ